MDVAPHGLAQVLAREQPTRVLEHEQRQFVFLVLQLHGCAIHPQAALLRIEPVAAEHQRAGRRLRIGAAQQGVAARHEFAHAQRLGHEVVGTTGQGLHQVLLGIAAGDEEDGHGIRCRAHGADHLQPLHVRQVPVHHQQVVGVRAQRLQQFPAFLIKEAGVPGPGGRGLQEFEKDRVVVENGNAHVNGSGAMEARPCRPAAARHGTTKRSKLTACVRQAWNLTIVCVCCAALVYRGRCRFFPVSRRQRLFLHRLDLLAQHVHLAAPVVAAAEPREVDREDRIAPAPCEPGAVMDEAQRAQRLDQREFAAVEIPELLVAVQQGRELLRALAPLARQQHPQVLHGRAHARVVQVHEMRAAARQVGGRPEHVARMAVAMQAQHRAGRGAAGARHLFFDQRDGIAAGGGPGRLLVQRDRFGLQQGVARFDGEAAHVQRRPLHERPRRAHGVDAREEAADPFQRVEILQVGRAAAAPGAHGKREARVRVQRAAFHDERRDRGHLGGGEFGGEGVFLQDLRLAPAARAVELGDHARAVLQMHLIDPVLVRAQGHQAAVAVQADGRERVQHEVGREVGVGVEVVALRRWWMVHGRHCRRQAAAASRG